MSKNKQKRLEILKKGKNQQETVKNDKKHKKYFTATKKP